MGSDWEPAPPISSGSPVSFQIGSLGAGIGVGCGVGIGFGGPLALGSLPVLGQAAQGISAGLGGLLPMFGGAGAAARAAVKGLGLQGLDAGFGCGVGIGYGFGAGLMLKPSVAEQMMRTGKQLAGQLTRTVTSKLPALRMAQPQHPQQQQQQGGIPGTQIGFGVTSSMPAVGPHLNVAGTGAATGIPVSQSTAQNPWGDVSGMTGGSGGGGVGVGTTGEPSNVQQHAAPAQQQDFLGGMSSNHANLPQQQQQQQDVVVAHTLLRQQEEIAQLKKQNRQLRQAVCRLDPRAPFCKDSGRRSRRGSRGLQDQMGSSDWPP